MMFNSYIRFGINHGIIERSDVQIPRKLHRIKHPRQFLTKNKQAKDSFQA